MIPDADTLKRIRAIGRHRAKESRAELTRHLPPLSLSEIGDLEGELLAMYLAGADAGYAAAKAEERKP